MNTKSSHKGRGSNLSNKDRAKGGRHSHSGQSLKSKIKSALNKW